MKTTCLSTALLALTAGAAIGADLSSSQVGTRLPQPPPAPMWTGFHAGLNAGYNFGAIGSVQSYARGSDVWAGNYTGSDANNGKITVPLYLSDTAGPSLSGDKSINMSGFTGGGQLGYNYQFGANFVFGLEADIQGSGYRGVLQGTGVSAAAVSRQNYFGNAATAASNSIGIATVDAGVSWLGTVRGRLGYLFAPDLLVYATGGLTYGDVYANIRQSALSSIQFNNTEIPIFGSSSSTSVNYTFFGGGRRSQTSVGWNAGGGLEWMFAPNWSLKGEGIYWNLGNLNIPTTAIAVAPNSSLRPLVAIGNVHTNYHGIIARVGINYHFNLDL